MTTNHTPGPWSVGQYEASDAFKKIERHTAVVQCTANGNAGLLLAVTGPAGDERSEADARVMAAAPRLLETAKKAVETILEENDQLWAVPWAYQIVAQLLDVIEEVEPGYAEELDKAS
jgi:hypothetical protein